jgi:hypothetical protein
MQLAFMMDFAMIFERLYYVICPIFAHTCLDPYVIVVLVHLIRWDQNVDSWSSLPFWFDLSMPHNNDIRYDTSC